MAKKVELPKLAKTAEELNTVLGCNPAIKIKGANEASLIKSITEASALIDKENDEFSAATVKVLKDLDIWDNIGAAEEVEEEEDDEDDAPITPAKKGKAAPAPAPKKKAAPVVEDEDEDDEDEDDEDEPEPVKPAKKGKPAPAPVPAKKGKAAPVEDDEDEDEDEAPKPKKAFGAIGDPTSQTGVIRAGIKAGKTKEQIQAILAKKFGKAEGWCKARFILYEKSYGEMGENDKNI